MKNLFSLIALCIVVLLAPLPAFAHPGNTGKNGGHHCWTNCSKWGLQYGEYHYHNGGSSSGGGSSYSSGNPFLPPVEVQHDYYNVFQKDRLLNVIDGYSNAVAYASMYKNAVIQNANTY